MDTTQNFKFRSMLLWIALIVSAISYQSAFAVTFMDGFETGDLSQTGGVSPSGFKWSGMSKNPIVVNGFAKDGKSSLRFRFSASAPGGQAWSEERYKLGGNYNNVWLKADIFIPKNYYCRGSEHNKGPFFLWSGNYGVATAHVGANFEHWCVNGNAYLTFNPGGEGVNRGHFATCLDSDCAPKGIPNGTPYSRGVPFVDRSKDLNKWHEWIIHLRPATTSTSNDGIVEVWKDGVKVWYRYDLYYHSDTNNYFDQGYIMGYSNSGFDQQTDIYYDNFVFSTERINSNVKAPLAPTSLSAQ